jgi:hypothetical protein
VIVQAQRLTGRDYSSYTPKWQPNAARWQVDGGGCSEVSERTTVMEPGSATTEKSCAIIRRCPSILRPSHALVLKHDSKHCSQKLLNFSGRSLVSALPGADGLDPRKPVRDGP